MKEKRGLGPREMFQLLRLLCALNSVSRTPVWHLQLPVAPERLTPSSGLYQYCTQMFPSPSLLSLSHIHK